MINANNRKLVGEVVGVILVWYMYTSERHSRYALSPSHDDANSHSYGAGPGASNARAARAQEAMRSACHAQFGKDFYPAFTQQIVGAPVVGLPVVGLAVDDKVGVTVPTPVALHCCANFGIATCMLTHAK